ncbi:hypothetical protein C8J30_11716 [Rhodobacter viridis]|uniref:Uncharacterized protein n=2 Tax=Rhodobacter viridis TaxID=1054202 RepID=A0A318TZB3_9RHOB|nr:hypothetical protein C8J30_11716 [Rhodobacter viridis]
MRYEDFEAILRDMVATIAIDEDWYRATYPDVDQAIRDGVITRAQEHYIASGYFEGRLPCAVTVDEAWYFETYPDVAAAHAAGEVSSATQHFLLYGYAEGRKPHG